MKHFIFESIPVVSEQDRKQTNVCKPCVIWLTGLSASGKSTLAKLLDTQLHAIGARSYILDGDNVRMGLCQDLGFSDADRAENIRRIAEVAKLFVEAGVVSIVAFISPFRQDRAFARSIMKHADEFIEVFVDAPLSTCESRDPKGLYAKARQGEIKNFTGLDSVYEKPLTPEVLISTEKNSVHACVEQIVNHLRSHHYLT